MRPICRLSAPAEVNVQETTHRHRLRPMAKTLRVRSTGSARRQAAAVGELAHSYGGAIQLQGGGKRAADAATGGLFRLAQHRARHTYRRPLLLRFVIDTGIAAARHQSHD